MAQKPRTCLQSWSCYLLVLSLRVSVSRQVMGGPRLAGPGGQGLTAQHSLTSSAYAQDRGSVHQVSLGLGGRVPTSCHPDVGCSPGTPDLPHQLGGRQGEPRYLQEGMKEEGVQSGVRTPSVVT